ncbi:hypothetical protein Hypma_001690 [Hypsizygus marmoreus]|uniref:MYND-type domain-containing protein n=1 Tax=Hypsizygus marmoreus TaxID=39966 RepID=A0A369J710_HYPMA|nr:hypothetical protein Hypma_001690 [Hypsizygus marmoreus]
MVLEAEPKDSDLLSDRLGGHPPPLVIWEDPCRTDFTLPPLASNVQDLCANAARSIAHLQSLITLLGSEVHLAHYPQVLDVFFCLLERLPPSSHVTPYAKQQVELAILALEGVHMATRCHVDTDSLHIEGSLFVTKALSSWQAMWRWMRHLYYRTDGELDLKFDAESRLPTETRLRMMVTIQCIISNIFHRATVKSSNSLCDTIRTTPGVFLMMTEIWTRQSDRPRDVMLPLDCLFLNFALSHFIDSALVDVDQFVEVVCADELRLARVLLKPLQLAAYGGEKWMATYPSTVGIYQIMARRTPRIYNILMSLDSILYICHAFTLFSSIPKLSTSLALDDHYHCIVSTCKTIVATFRATDGFTWIIRAIHLHLIPCVLRSAAWASPNIDELLISILQFLESHIFYRSILRPLGKAMNSKVAIDLGKCVPRSGKFWPAWSRFSTIALRMLRMKSAFDKHGKYSRKCTLTECDRIEAAGGFKLCGACHDAVYCSESCQRQDWKEHQTLCKSICEHRTAGKHLVFPFRDIAFFAFLTDEEMRLNRVNIIQGREKALSSAAFSGQPLRLLFDYTSCPPSSTVIRAPRSLDSPQEARSKLRRPLMQPCIMVLYGKDQTVLPIPSHIAGDLFGWIEHPDSPLVDSLAPSVRITLPPFTVAWEPEETTDK